MKNLFENCSGILLTSEANIYYFTKYTSDEAYVLLTPQKTYFLTDFRYMEMAQNTLSSAFEYVQYDSSNKFQIINELIADAHIHTLGIEQHTLTVFEHNMLKTNTIAIDDAINELRSIKSKTEIDIIRKGAQLTQDILKRLISTIKPGMREHEISAELKFQINRHGLDIAFEPIIASGENTSLPHAQPTYKKLTPGDLVTIDMGIKFQGYCTDITRTIAISGLDENKKKMYNTVMYANELAEKALCSGVVACDIDKIARDFIDSNGYKGCFGHGLGHGVGVEVHEFPAINPNAKHTLKSGMVLTIEPGIYIKGSGGVRIEDMLCIAEDGYENFYNLTKELIIV